MIKRKTRRILDIAYYDELFIKDIKLKEKLFKKHDKIYSVKKLVKRYTYPLLRIKKNEIFIDLKEHSFAMSNNFFGVTNLLSYKKAILKGVPSFEKIFALNTKDYKRKNPARDILLKHVVHFIDESAEESITIGTSFKKYTDINAFFLDYEKFMRDYHLNKAYHFTLKTLEVIIEYCYYETKKNKRKENLTKETN